MRHERRDVDEIPRPGFLDELQMIAPSEPGAAAHYEPGRLPYAPALAEALERSLGLDGRGRLLDVGCGPGTVTLLLARLFEEVVGLDPDGDMLREAARLASLRAVSQIPAAMLAMTVQKTHYGKGVLSGQCGRRDFGSSDRGRSARDNGT